MELNGIKYKFAETINFWIENAPDNAKDLTDPTYNNLYISELRKNM